MQERTVRGRPQERRGTIANPRRYRRPSPRHAGDGGASRPALWHILSDAWEGLQGEPFDGEHPERDFWIVVAALFVPVYIFIDQVCF